MLAFLTPSHPNPPHPTPRLTCKANLLYPPQASRLYPQPLGQSLVWGSTKSICRPLMDTALPL